jgi:hypothetical protein
LPLSCTFGAFGARAASSSITNGKTSYSTSIKRSASNACCGVSAATAATSSPSWRQCGSKSLLKEASRRSYHGMSAPGVSAVTTARTPGILAA